MLGDICGCGVQISNMVNVRVLFPAFERVNLGDCSFNEGLLGLVPDGEEVARFDLVSGHHTEAGHDCSPVTCLPNLCRIQECILAGSPTFDLDVVTWGDSKVGRLPCCSRVVKAQER